MEGTFLRCSSPVAPAGSALVSGEAMHAMPHEIGYNATHMEQPRLCYHGSTITVGVL